MTQVPEGKDEFEKMVSGRPYISLVPYLIQLRSNAKLMMLKYNNEIGYDLDMAKRHSHISQMLGAVGENAIIEPPFRCDYGINISVGRNFYCNFDCVFLDCAKITIGDDVLLGPGVQLYTATHPLDSHERHVIGTESANPIQIGSKVWLGGKVIVLGNVSIGDGCVIGAGSVVTRDVPPYSLAVGSPARVVRQLL